MGRGAGCTHACVLLTNETPRNVGINQPRGTSACVITVSVNLGTVLVLTLRLQLSYLIMPGQIATRCWPLGGAYDLARRRSWVYFAAPPVGLSSTIAALRPRPLQQQYHSTQCTPRGASSMPTGFQADFIDNVESANKRRAMRLWEHLDRIFPKPPFPLDVHPPPPLFRGNLL